MPTVTFKREVTKFSGAGAKLMVVLDRKKYFLKNGEEITLDVKAGKHKVIMKKTLLLRFIGALLGQFAARLKYKFRLEENQHQLIECGIKGRTIWYDAHEPVTEGSPQ